MQAFLVTGYFLKLRTSVKIQSVQTDLRFERVKIKVIRGQDPKVILLFSVVDLILLHIFLLLPNFFPFFFQFCIKSND